MDNIKVAVRCRPFNKRELELGAIQSINIIDKQVVLTNNSNSKDGRKSNKSFTYDYCFDSSSADKPNYATQQAVYDGLGVDILENSMAGYNACIFAYGQTGSGKSYTMMGSTNNDHKGIIPRLCQNLFERISLNTSQNLTFKVEVSYMEIYNEKVRDLLYPSCSNKQNLKVREHRLLGVYVDGLSHLAVSSYKDIEEIINEGNKSRTVASTNMNAESSRSHAVFCVKVSQNIVDTESNISGEKLSRISLVDLAGSEKVSKSGVDSGDRLKECSNINKSLLTLGLVISALSESSNKNKHIPYRDSVLTWLLKDSLGGNSKTAMIFTISPSVDNYEESLSTLRYAERAKQIVNNAVINEDPNAKIIRNLREELDMLRKELEAAKEKINAELLNDKLIESEKLYKEISKPWDEKLADTVKIQQEWSHTLQTMGISVESSGIKVEKDKFYLVNLNADPSMNELLVYYLKDLTLVGRCNAKNKQDIELMGMGIAEEHCAFYMKNNHVCVAPIKEAKTWVNGKLIHGETLLHHGDRIALGMNHFFRLNCPADDLANEITKKSFDDYNKAQEEILLQNRHISSNIITHANEEISNNNNLEEIENENEEKSVSSSTTFSNSNSIDENGLTIEMAIQKFEHDYANFKSDRITNLDHSMLSNSSSTSSLGMTTRNSSSKSFQNQTNDSNRHKSYSILNDLKFRKGLQNLREKLLRANSLAREANSLCKELNRPLKFRTTLQIPPNNLTPNRKKDSLLSEPAIIIKVKENKSSNDFKRNSDNDKIIIDFETFENYIFELREAYSDKFKQSKDEKNDEDLESEQIIPKIFTKSQSYYFNLIGVANIFLDVLSYEAAIPFEYYVGIINQQGELAGRLKIKLEVLSPIKLNENSSSQDEEENQQDLNSKKIVKYRFNIIEAIELPINLNNLVFCQYKFWSQSEPTIVRSVKESSNKNSKSLNNYSAYSTVKFDHEKEFEIEVNEDFNEYCLDSALSVEIYSHRHINPTNGIIADKTQLEKIEKLNKMAKFQSLVDSWSELSKSYELNVKILELDNEGSWSPVEVKPHQLNLTGGIYQLKQGQSRQISVNINQVKSKSVMHYNGTLFYLEPHKIDKISVGCVYGTNIGLQAPLDSYQEVDLNKLRNKCRTILENRKSYLHVQIKSLYESDKLEDQERRDLLSKQLIDLGEEIVEIDAPRENSGLPGSTIEWTPSEGMEEHVPIIYLDLNESQIDKNLDANDSDDERENHTKNKISTYGDDCYLKNEPQNARFIDLKLIRWNDSSLVEVVDNELNDYNNDFDYSSGGDETEEYTNNSQSSTSNLSLKATARWDSSVHQSLYLNQPTPLDRHVYLTIKINLKFKKLDTNNKFINEYVNVVLRKRICVCVYVPSASTKLINLNRFKTLLGSSPNLNKIKTKIINNIGPLSSVSSCYSTGITYRIIANIPRLLSEIENRESLAIQAAASINEDINNLSDDNKKSNNKNSINILEDSLSYFEHYAKTIEAVEKILKQDRIYQRLHIEKIINFVQKNGHLPSDIDELDLNKKDNDDSLSKSSFFQKTLSVPNLIKNGLGSVKNMSVMSPKPVTKTNKVFNKSIEETQENEKIHNDPKTNVTSDIIKNKKPSSTAQQIFDLYNTVNKNQEQKNDKQKSDFSDKEIEASILKDLGFGDENEDEKNKTISNIQESTTIDSTNHQTIKSNLEISSTNLKENISNSSLSLNKCETLTVKSVVAEEEENEMLNRAQSINSLSSTISQQQKKELRQQQIKQQIAELPEWIKENARVIVSTTEIMNKPGHIRYIGPTKFAHGVWIGVELDDSVGKNDGSYNGVCYFSCPKNKGVFVKKEKITLFVNKI